MTYTPKYLKRKLVFTSTVDAISTKSILAATIEGSLSVITNCVEAAVVCFDGAFVDIYTKVADWSYVSLIFPLCRR